MRVTLVCCALLAVCVPRAHAEIRVIDVASGASTTLVAGSGARLIRWTDDGAGLLVGDDRGGVARAGLDGSTTPQPQLQGAIGPGGRTVAFGDGAAELRAPDGRVVATQPGEVFDVAWSGDGSRVALAIENRLLLVRDTATGAVLLRRERPARFSDQAFAADGSSLVVTDDERVLRIDIATGRAVRVYRARGSGAALPAVLSATGRIAVTRLGPIPVIDGPTVDITGDPSLPAQWSPDGTTLAISFLHVGDDGCSPYAYHGLGVVQPGAPVRVLIAPGERELETPRWSPDGTRVAVEVGPDYAAKRGRGHAWPRRVARDYGMTRAGDAAARRVLLRASRSLRRGESREAVMNGVRRDWMRVERRLREARRGSVRSAVATELDRWLRAAGFPATEGSIEIVC